LDLEFNCDIWKNHWLSDRTKTELLWH